MPGLMSVKVSNGLSEICVDCHSRVKKVREETQTHLQIQNVEDITRYQSKWLKHRDRIPPEYLSWLAH
jgi:hypothetical protein